MTIIYSNSCDIDCSLLPCIWRDIENVNLIEIRPDSVNWEETVDHAIENENDTIVFCGHGSSYGLFFPDLNRGEYIVHQNNVNLIHARNVICIWCYARDFCERNNLHAFTTDMFITNMYEASVHHLTISDPGITQLTINDTNSTYYNELNCFLRNNTPINEWCERIAQNININNEIDTYNRLSTYYI